MEFKLKKIFIYFEKKLKLYINMFFLSTTLIKNFYVINIKNFYFSQNPCVALLVLGSENNQIF